jgi:hypothetical protein
MDCITFRNRKLAAPHETDMAALEHERVCAACAGFAREVEVFERRVQQVARVRVPDGLAEQIVRGLRAQNMLGRNPPQRLLDVLREALAGGGHRLSLALGAAAATLVIALAGVLAVTVGAGREALADRVIAHVIDEPEVLEAQEVVAPEQLSAAFARYGAKVRAPLGEVRHLGYCLVDGALAQHVVVGTPYGPVTLILVPGEAARSRPRTKDGFTAVVVPLRGGSLGIVTQSPGRIQPVEEFVTSRVRVEG